MVEKTKLTELEDKIPDVSSLATKTALTIVENKILKLNCQVLTEKLHQINQNTYLLKMS